MGDVIDINRLEQCVRTHRRDCRADPCHTGKTVKEVILGPEHDRGAQNNSIGHVFQHAGLSHRLGLGIVAIGLGIRTDGRDLNQALHPFGSRQARNTLSTVSLNRVKGVLASLGQNPNAVHHRISAPQRIAHRCIIADVAKDRFDLPNGAIGTHEQRFVRAAHRNAYTPSRQCHAANNIPPHKPGTAVNRDQLCHDDTPDQKI